MRVLIVRLSAVGDVLHTLPLACAVRDAQPEWEIAWLVEGRTAALLAGHDALDRVFVAPRGWLKSPRKTWDLARALRAWRPNVALDVQGLFRSALAARLSGAPRRIGYAAPQGRELSAWLNNERVAPRGTHVVDRNLELLAPLNIVPQQVEFRVPRFERAAEHVCGWLAPCDQAAGFAVVNPGAGWPSKRWPRERFAQVAQHLTQQGLNVLVVWGGAEEQPWAEEIAALAGGATRGAPATSLPELAEVLRRARLLVSADTGPLHLAAALGTPCVGLFGPMPAARNGPYGPGHIAVQRMQVAGSSRVRRSAPPTAMEAIAVDDVCAACDRLLAGTPAAAA